MDRWCGLTATQSTPIGKNTQKTARTTDPTKPGAGRGA